MYHIYHKYYLYIYIKCKYLSFFKIVKPCYKDDSWPVAAGRMAGIMWFISLATESGPTLISTLRLALLCFIKAG